MTFVTDKEVLKPGLIIFRRADVDHRNWYCRVKLPKADRYKTISLKTANIGVARHLANEQEIRVRVRLESDIPVFNHPFRAVAKEYLATQEARAKRGEISKERPKKLKAVIVNAGYITRSKLMSDHLRSAQEKISAVIVGAVVGQGRRPSAKLSRWLHSTSRMHLRDLLAQNPDELRALVGSRSAMRKLEIQAARCAAQRLDEGMLDAPSRRLKTQHAA